MSDAQSPAGATRQISLDAIALHSHHAAKVWENRALDLQDQVLSLQKQVAQLTVQLEHAKETK